MLLAVDAGNTNIVFAVFQDNRLLQSWRLSTNPKRTADEYWLQLANLMQLSGISAKEIDDIIIACVVPHSLFALRLLGKKYFSRTPLVVGDRKINLGIKVLLSRPSEVGADRLVNAIGAYALHKKAAIIVDLGTATTFDVISDSGDYLGGVIAPGVDLSIEALHRAAAKLPEIAVEKPRYVIGRSTVSAMQSGIYWGYISLIEGIVSRIKQEYGAPLITIATGGLAPLFAKSLPAIEELQPDLTINGLNQVYLRNKKAL
ncbi:MAG: type III pantothenate kinase [Rectinemataceae bacterium]|nr:type III pantothenate kinase [Rectinemataceae bacterium]